LYHVGAVFVLGINVSIDDPILKTFATESYSKGPFVLMVERAGIPALGDWIKVVTILALVSVANTRLYVSVCQCLVSLIVESGFVRSFDGRTSTQNLPKEGILECADIQRSRFCCSGSFGFCFSQDRIKECLSLLEDCLRKLYDVLQSMIFTCALLSWAVICFTYLQFRAALKAQRQMGAIPQEARSPLQPYLAIYGLSMVSLLSTALPSHPSDNSYIPGVSGIYSQQAKLVSWNFLVGVNSGSVDHDCSDCSFWLGMYCL
jgi:amino acid permease